MVYEDYQLIRVATADGVCRATIDNPPINLLDVPLLSEIDRLAREVATDDDVRVLIVDSADPEVFIAHADVGLIMDLPPDDIGPHDELSLFHAVTEQVRTLPKATIAVIDGVCRGGGCEFAMAFDMRFAALGATVLGHPELAVGIIPGGGGTQRMARLIGPSRAKDLIFTGRMVDAQEALAIGLVDQVVPADEVYSAARSWAEQFVDGPAMALAAAKKAIDGGLDVDLRTGLDLEAEFFAALFATEDRQTGMTSFAEHGPGKAKFSGH